MTRTRPIARLFFVTVLAAGWLLLVSTAAVSGAKDKDARGFKEFTDRVQGYLRLHKSVEATLPRLKPTDLPEMIAAHEQALARKIREARPRAQRGEIFTRDAREAFHHAIHEEFHGPHAPHVRATMRQSTIPVAHLRVNDDYPQSTPLSTVPPTLLLRLPKLPEELSYRIVGVDLILLDVKANLVIDLIREVFPKDS